MRGAGAGRSALGDDGTPGAVLVLMTIQRLSTPVPLYDYRCTTTLTRRHPVCCRWGARARVPALAL